MSESGSGSGSDEASAAAGAWQGPDGQLPGQQQGWANPARDAQPPQDFVPQTPPQPGYGQPGYGQPPQFGQSPQYGQMPPQPVYGQPPQYGYPPKRPGNGRRVAVLGSVGAVVVIALVVTLVLVTRSSGSSPAAAGSQRTSAFSAPAHAASPVPPCPTAASISSETSGYQACGTAARSVGVPTFDSAAAHKSYIVTLHTNRGDVVFTADGKDAPYTVYSFLYLVQKSYFSNTPCHRLTTSGIYVLQCGDPTGTGAGGPGYEFPDENLAALGESAGDSVDYHAGMVAMANAGPGTNGSQFFLVYEDSPIAPDFTPFGTITRGLGILTQIAAGGTDDENGQGDGVPKESVTIESVTMTAA